MKRILFVATVMTAVVGGSWVAAQTVPAPKPGAGTPARPQRGGGMGYGMGTGMMGGGMGPGMMGGGMMGGGMMGGGMMGMGSGMCPMMMGDPSLKLDLKKIDKGVTITITSTDAAAVARLQKMAEAMRLMHEAMTE